MVEPVTLGGCNLFAIYIYSVPILSKVPFCLQLKIDTCVHVTAQGQYLFFFTYFEESV